MRSSVRMIGIQGSRYAVLNLYNLILVLSFTQLVQCTADDDLVKVKVYTDKALLFEELYWYHVATEVSGGGAWLRGVGCLSNDTCAFLNSDQNNAIKVGGYQSCINPSSCVKQKFIAAVVDPVQVLKLRIRRDEDGKILEVTASCSNRIGYTLWTSDGASQYMRFTYSELEDNGTWTGHYKCERDSTATISSTTSKPTNDSTGTAEPPNNTSPTLTSVPPHPETSTGSYNLTISQNSSSTGGQNSTPMTGATSESTNRDVNETKRADKTSSGPNLTTIISPVVVGGVAVVAIVAAVLVLCRHRYKNSHQRTASHTTQLTASHIAPLPNHIYDNQLLEHDVSFPAVDYENHPSLLQAPACPSYKNVNTTQVRELVHQASEGGGRLNDLDAVYTSLVEDVDHEYTISNV